jgi:hypothetical protein
MARKRPHRISSTFARKAIEALDSPLPGVEDQLTRMWYRLNGVEKPPPSADGDWDAHDTYLAGLDVRNRDNCADRDYLELRAHLASRIHHDPGITEDELCSQLRAFYSSRSLDKA